MTWRDEAEIITSSEVKGVQMSTEYTQTYKRRLRQIADENNSVFSTRGVGNVYWLYCVGQNLS
jgi:hypothetical protein